MPITTARKLFNGSSEYRKMIDSLTPWHEWFLTALWKQLLRPRVANWQLIRVEKGGYLQALRFLFQAATLWACVSHTCQTLPRLDSVVRLLGYCRYVFGHAHRRASLARIRDHQVPLLAKQNLGYRCQDRTNNFWSSHKRGSTNLSIRSPRYAAPYEP
jgi:hypothetical protein